MAHLQQQSATYTLRKICQKIQNKIQQYIKSTQQQLKSHKQTLHTQQSTQLHINKDYLIFQTLKSSLIRTITSQLPLIVNYQNSITQKLLDLQQQNKQFEIQLKSLKQLYHVKCKQNDNLNIKLIGLEEKINCLQDEKGLEQEKYNQVLLMAKKYMKRNEELEEEMVKRQYEEENFRKIKQEDNKNNLNNNTHTKKKNKELQQYEHTNNNDRQYNYNIPQQIKQKLNEAQNILKRSPIPINDARLQSSQFHLSSQIIGCQKQLLQYQLKQCTKQLISLRSKLQQQCSYSTKLQKQVQELQKLMQGEHKLKENLDREIYLLINSNKEMKIEVLEWKAKCEGLEEEVGSLQEEIEKVEEINKQMNQKIKKMGGINQMKEKVEEDLLEMKTKMEISQKKYDQLRKLKQQLQVKVEQFQSQLQQLQRKQSQHQISSAQTQITLKQQNCIKIKQIQQMSLMIKQKYQHKINILQSSIKQIKQKYKHLKQQNQRLYEGLQVQVKKQMKIENKYKEIKIKYDEIVGQNLVLKKDKEVLEEKVKMQNLVGKQMKRQLNFVERVKERVERKYNKVKISVLPKILYEMKSLRSQKQKIQTQVQNFSELLQKLKNKFIKQMGNMLQTLSEDNNSKILNFQLQLKDKQGVIDSLKRQNDEICTQKLEIFQKLNTLEENNKTLLLKIKVSQQSIKSSQLSLQMKSIQIKDLISQRQKFSLQNKKLQQQIQQFLKIQKHSQQQIQLLKQKQKQVQSFYDLIQQLTVENNHLKELVVGYQKNQKKFNVNLNNNNNIDSTYTIPYKDNDYHQKTLLYQNNSNSCVHLHGNNKKASYTHLNSNVSPLKQFKSSLDKNKNTYDFMNMANQNVNAKSHLVYNNRNNHFSFDRANKQSNLTNLHVKNSQNYQYYQQKHSKHSNPPVFYSRTNLKSEQNQQYSYLNDNDTINNNDEQHRTNNDFQVQKNRLEQIKRQYKKKMVEKIKDQIYINNDKKDNNSYRKLY